MNLNVFGLNVSLNQKNKSDLEIHKLIHKSVKQFKCNKMFKQKRGLNVHKLIQKKEKPFKCNQCDNKFRQIYHLKTHKMRIGQELQ